jgi:RHS repeat-associated protein
VYRNALGLLGDLTYQYDPAGNRTTVGGSFARTLLPDPVPSATYDAANRQLAFGNRTMAFDDNGNLTTLTEGPGSTAFAWDARNRLTTLTGTATASFAYDATARRARRQIDGELREYQYDGLDVVRELANGVEVTYMRTLGIDETLTRIEAGDSSHYLADVLSSTLALSDPSGSITTTYSYEPFGRTVSNGLTSGNSFQFTGRENDGTGFFYYRSRYYSPMLHRFITQDPILAPMSLLGGCLGSRANRTVWLVPGMINGEFPLTDPSSLTSAYIYVGNTPVASGDPTGLDKDRRPEPCMDYSSCMTACLVVGVPVTLTACAPCLALPPPANKICVAACAVAVIHLVYRACDDLCNQLRCR